MLQPSMTIEVLLNVNPKQLRRWAKAVTEKLATAEGGDDMGVDAVIGHGVVVHIVADQTYKPKPKRPKKKV